MARDFVGGVQTQPKFLIDTAKLNRKYQAHADNPYRTWTGTTSVPADCTGGALKSMLYEAGCRYVDALEKKGWSLSSKLRVISQGYAKSDSGFILADKIEYHFIGIFKCNLAPRIVRLEIPAEMVDQHDGQLGDLKAIQRAL